MASRWLEAHCDRSAGVSTLPGNVILADVSGDNDCRLVLSDVKFAENERSRLKVYKGTVLHSDQPLPEVPSGLIAFYCDNFDPRTQAVAAACGSELLIYKNNKPYYKFSVPTLTISALEQDLWQKLSSDPPDAQKIIEELKNIPYSSLSSRSQKLMKLPLAEAKLFVGKYSGSRPARATTITCMTTINRNSQEERAVACPVLCTECGQIYVLEPQGFSVVHQGRICNFDATPFVARAGGMFDVEFRIFVACREGFICVIKKGWLEGKIVLHAPAHIIDLVVVPGDLFLTFAMVDKNMCSYTRKGNKIWSKKLPLNVTCMSLIHLKHLSKSLVAVGLRGGSINLYSGRHQIDSVTAPDTPSALVFGHLGQEEHVFVIVTLGGTINFKILKRTANFSSTNEETNSIPTNQNKPLPLPKRSKLFLEQNMRERQHGLEMHQKYQEDLIRLRLIAARAMMQLQGDQSGAGNSKEQLKMSAQVLGLGPKFSLILSVENMNEDRALSGLTAVFHCKPTIYTLNPYVIKIPLIPPSTTYKIQTKVTDVAENSLADATIQVIRVFIVKPNQIQPVLAATVNMPPTDPMGYIV